MNYGILSFTARGSNLNKELCKALTNKGHVVKGYAIAKYAEEIGLLQFTKISTLLEEIFPVMDGIIFISACGIAVRGIAPFLHSKGCDPGVVVIDEGGNYAISLLSGHIGGGNWLCNEVAKIAGAIPIITTATDINNVFSVDSFAKEKGLWIKDLNQIKKISSAILDGEKVSLYCDYPVTGKLPSELINEPLEKGICISENESLAPFPVTINLIPRDLILGIGCKKNTSVEAISDLVEEVFNQLNLNKYRIGKIASIDIKASEAGIIEFTRKVKADFITYSTEELKNVPGDFVESVFVNQTVGVGNVCERSGALASNDGRKILGKTTKDGVAISIYKRDYILEF
ncbi:MAG: cobalamin [Anaerocolumna sp.]|jgi:cobalt-precorrin 5A hydrolase|nr:cobalamin [Anaerocolumna sp.]